MEQCLIAGKRGYSGIRLKRARQCPPGFEFGGPRFLENIDRAMKLDPPPVPPIKVSFIPITGECCISIFSQSHFKLFIRYEE